MSKKISFNIITLVFCFLFIVALIRFLMSAESLTFASFLNSLTTIPDIGLTGGLIDMSIVGDWGLFNFLKDFLNIFTSMISISIYIFGLILNLLLVLVWVVKFFFI